MGLMRGVILILFGVIAFYRGFTLHAGSRAWSAFALGAAAVALGIWHILRQRR